MQSLCRSIRILRRIGGSGCSAATNSLTTSDFIIAKFHGYSAPKTNMRSLGVVQMESNEGIPSLSSLNELCQPTLLQMAAIMPHFPTRSMTTEGLPVEMPSQSSGLPPDPPARIKFKRLDKTVKHIMQIIDTEAVEEVKVQKEIPDIRPGYII